MSANTFLLSITQAFFATGKYKEQSKKLKDSELNGFTLGDRIIRDQRDLPSHMYLLYDSL